jgi:ribose transport system ATP-binding protein
VHRLAISGIQKSFGATAALRNVSFSVKPGEVHALLGENGAGKSTLMKILSGAHSADAGTITLDGKPYLPRSPIDALRSGVAMIYQELNLAPHLTVAENILLGAEPRSFGWVNQRRQREEAARILADMDYEGIPLDAPALTLPIAEQQIIEIARALRANPRVLIMDEPTSSLSRRDATRLFQTIRRLAARGVSVIYISHFLEECREICSGFTVLRDGEFIASGQLAEISETQLVKWIVGREVKDIYPRNQRRPGAVVLETRRLRGKKRPVSADFQLRAGEILGIAGLIGAGRTEMLRAIFGLDPSRGDAVFSGLERSRRSPAFCLEQGAGMVSENRKEEGLMTRRTVAENMSLAGLNRVSRLGWIRGKQEHHEVSAWIEKFSIKARGPSQITSELSGGNQQKIAIARLLFHDARVLLLDEPTRGIDVGSKSQIYQWMNESASRGAAVLFVSSYIPELLGVCDRIAVMSRGVLSAARPVAEWSEESILSAAIGSVDASASSS